MRVDLGNSSPIGTAIGPCVTTTGVTDAQHEDGSYVVTYTIGTDAAEVKEHLFDNPGLVTHLPGNTALIQIISSWTDHSQSKPSWVSVTPEDRDPAEAEDLERFLSDFWKIPRGAPADLEDTHYTVNGPPGIGPSEGE